MRHAHVRDVGQVRDKVAEKAAGLEQCIDRLIALGVPVKWIEEAIGRRLSELERRKK